MSNKTADQLKLEQLITAKCEENSFVRSKNSYYSQDDPFVDTNKSDYGLRFAYFDDIQKLRHAFLNYSGLRSVYIYKDLVFVNALIDGWEAWTLKRFGDKLMEIDTISIRIVIKYNTEEKGKKLTFEEYIDFLNAMTETEITFYMQRELTPKELADLSEEWENPTVDTSKYYQSVVRAWEVREELYNKWKAAGGLCQKHDGKFYVA